MDLQIDIYFFENFVKHKNCDALKFKLGSLKM